jgi:twitching motility protein PilI
MAQKDALRELQGRLAERLQAARTLERPAGWLAVECEGHGFLLPLAEAGEIFQAGAIMRVPHARHWFLGVANLRGSLTGVIDLAGFLGLRGARAQRDPQARLIALNPGLELNAALLVDRLAGLRNAEQLTDAQPVAGPAPEYAGPRWRDATGRHWQELRLAALAFDERFTNIVAGA